MIIIFIFIISIIINITGGAFIVYKIVLILDDVNYCNNIIIALTALIAAGANLEPKRNGPTDSTFTAEPFFT